MHQHFPRHLLHQPHINTSSALSGIPPTLLLVAIHLLSLPSEQVIWVSTKPRRGVILHLAPCSPKKCFRRAK
jgi:hypothetical protein